MGMSKIVHCILKRNQGYYRRFERNLKQRFFITDCSNENY